MPYIAQKERTKKLNDVSDIIYNMFLEFLETGNAKYINYVISRGALKAWKDKYHYEEGRRIKSVLKDILDEFVNRVNEYEKNARKKNGDLI